MAQSFAGKNGASFVIKIHTKNFPDGFSRNLQSSSMNQGRIGIKWCILESLILFLCIAKCIFKKKCFPFSINKLLTFFERRTERGYNKYVDISADQNRNPIYRISTSEVLYRSENIKRGAISSFATLKHLLRDPEIPGCNYSDIINMQ